jgi:ribosomal protein S19
MGEQVQSTHQLDNPIALQAAQGSEPISTHLGIFEGDHWAEVSFEREMEGEVLHKLGRFQLLKHFFHLSRTS